MAGCSPCRPVGSACSLVKEYNPYSPCTTSPPAPPVLFLSTSCANVTRLAGVSSAVAFPVSIIPYPAYDTISSSFIAPSTGRYAFLATVTWSMTLAASTMLTLFLTLNAVNTSFASSVTSAEPGYYVTTVQGCLQLTAGDVVGVTAQSTQDVIILGSSPSSAPLTFFRGQIVS